MTAVRSGILVVEDQMLQAIHLSMSLEREGYEPMGPCSSVDEALDMLDTATPAAALLTSSSLSRGRPRASQITLIGMGSAYCRYRSISPPSPNDATSSRHSSATRSAIAATACAENA